jgi:hypothetical protein
MKFDVLLLICFFAVAAPVVAQEQVCDLEIKNAPAVQNLKLGMSPEAVQAVFGRALKIKIKKNGNRVFFQNFIKKPAPQSLSGVRALYLRFFDRRLYQIEIFYEDKPEWRTLADFTRSQSIALNLPEDLWRNVRSRREISCADFSVFADKLLNPKIELTDRKTLSQAEEFLQRQSK